MSKIFVNAHCHSAIGSILDSTQTPEDIIKCTKDLGMNSVALTDHGSLAGHIQFINAGKKHNIKTILGIEAYFVDDVQTVYKLNDELGVLEEKEKLFKKDKGKKVELKQLEERKTELRQLRIEARRYNHLILLAKNQNGYNNLIKIHNDAVIDGFYYKPRCDWKVIEKHKGDIIATSACLGSRTSKLIAAGDIQGAKEAIARYKQVFGDGNFFLELQLNEIKLQKDVNDVLIKLAEETSTPLTISLDAHYTFEGQNSSRILLRQLDKESGEIFDDQLTDLYIKNEDMLLKSWRQYMGEYPAEILAEAILNTRKISDSIESFSIDNTLKFPDFETGEFTQEEFLSAKALEGLENRGFHTNKQYIDRLNSEMKDIKKLGFSSYFNVITDLINHEKERQQVGVGRGSIGGSLLAYCLGISNVDPIRYGLYFERFISEQKGVYAPTFGLPINEVHVDYNKIQASCICHSK